MKRKVNLNNMDVTIITPKRIFRAHKITLSQHSDYFSAMFYHGLMRENQTEVVDLSQSVVTATGFRCVLKYINSGILDMSVDDLDEVMTAIDYLQLVCLQDLMCLKVWQDTDASNFTDIWNVIRKFPQTYYYELSLNIFIRDHFCLELTDQYPSQLYHLTLDQLQYILQEVPLKRVESEYEIFQIVMKWLEGCEHQEHAYELLRSCVKLHLIPLQKLTDVVRPKLSSLGDPRLLHLEETQRKYHLHPVQQAMSSLRYEDLRFAEDVIARVYGRLCPANGFVGRGLEVYDGQLGIWRKTTCRINTNLVPNAATVMLDNFLYVAGGNCKQQSGEGNSGQRRINQNEVSSSPSSLVYRYNPRIDSWIEVTPMKTGRVNFCMVACHDKIYAIGGTISETVQDTTGLHHRTKVLDCMECYRPYSNTWSPCAHLIKPVSHCKGACVNGKVYVMDSTTGCLQRYLPSSNKWEFLGRLHQCRKVHAVLSWQGFCYVLLSEAGCKTRCAHLYMYSEQAKALKIAAPCLRLSYTKVITVSTVIHDVVVVITNSAGNSGIRVWDGEKWGNTYRSTGRCFGDKADTNFSRTSPLDSCVLRIPRYLLNPSNHHLRLM